MIWAELTHWMALGPLLFLCYLHVRGEDRDTAYWMLAVAFAVSFLADTAAHWVDPWAVSVLYPVSQASLVAAVFLVRRDAAWVAFGLVSLAVLIVLFHGTNGPDVILRSAAWIAVCLIVSPLGQLGHLRTALLIYFGLGLVAWWVHARWLIVATWYPYQAIRAIGLGWFCVASARPGPKLRVLRVHRRAA